MQLLRWDQGRFSFEADVASPERTINKPLDSLLLEVAYRTDTEAGSAEALRATSVLTPVAAPAAARTGENVELPLVALQVLPLFNARRSLADISQRLDLPVNEVLMAANAIIKAGLARPQSSAHIAPEFIHSLTRLLRDIMGPLADIIMEEALFDLNLSTGPVPQDQLPALLEALGQEVSRERSDWRGIFTARATELLERHGFRLEQE